MANEVTARAVAQTPRGREFFNFADLVENHIPDAEINTHPLLVTAAVKCFRRLGARLVTVAEGPGHQRGTPVVLQTTAIPQRTTDSLYGPQSPRGD